MNNELKKDYAKPEIIIVEMDYEGNLLDESCTFVGDGGLCSAVDDNDPDADPDAKDD